MTDLNIITAEILRPSRRCMQHLAGLSSCHAHLRRKAGPAFLGLAR